MKIFDEYIARVSAMLTSCIEQTEGVDMAGTEGSEAVAGQISRVRRIGADELEARTDFWPIENKTPFIMERDTAVELGGYPKESINLITYTSGSLPFDGVLILGEEPEVPCSNSTWFSKKAQSKEPQGSQPFHVSFGKLIFLRVSEDAGEDIYALQQAIQMADVKFRPKNVMQRSSSQQPLTNYRVSRKAQKDGFNLEIMACTLQKHFLSLPQVKEASVVLLVGESPLYAQLQPLAEEVKKISVTLSTQFDGVDMDCGSCSMSPICDEVEELRELHKGRR